MYKNRMGFWVLGTAVLAAAGAALCWRQAARADREMRLALMQQACLLAETIRHECVAALSGSDADLESPVYLRLKRQFAAFKHADDRCRFVYLLGCKEDGRLFFFVDNEPAGSEDESPPGQVYAEASEDLRRVFRTGQAGTEGPYTDRWGTFVSGLAPIHDPDTKAVSAVLGVDIEAGDWRLDLARAALPPALFTLLLFAILSAGVVLSARRTRLAGAAPGWMRHIDLSWTVAVGLGLTSFAAWMAGDRERHVRQAMFSQLAASRTHTVAERLRHLYATELEGLAQFYEGSEGVTRGEFQQYTSFITRNPAVEIWGWVAAVPAAEKTRFEHGARAEGLHGFAIWQRDAHGARMPAAGRHVYYPVLRAAPMLGNEWFLGYDLGSEPLLHAALQEAGRTGLVTSSEPTTLVGGAAGPQVMVLFRPVFGHGLDHQDGFAMAALRPHKLLEIVDADVSGTCLELALMRPDGGGQSLAATQVECGSLGKELAVVRPVFAFGRALAVKAHATPAFLRLHPSRAGFLIGLTGVLLTAALALVLGMLLRRRTVLEGLVAERTRDLQQSMRQHDLFFSQALHGFFLMMIDEPIEWNADTDKEKVLDYVFAHQRMTRANQALLDQYGAREKDFIGLTPGDLFAHDLAHGRSIWRGIFDRGRWHVETDERRLDGSPMVIDGDYICLYDDKGRMTGHLGVQVDITARKKSEEARARSERELKELNAALEEQTLIATAMAAEAERASKAKSDFLANMSHEIRTPMNGVIGMTGLLLDTELTEEQRRYAEIARASGEFLLALINDILDVSKIEAGKLDLETLDFDLLGLLDDFAAAMGLRANDKGLELLCSADPDVPALLRGDPGRLRQILVNLVGNAIKFTARGEVAIRVALEDQAEDAVVLRFTVRDTGIGIPEDKIGLLFNKFTQADASTTRRFGGTGLGLAISKQLAEMMGGAIGVSSRAGEGSEFWFTVRLTLQPDVPLPEATHTAGLEGERVLVVDDSATNREVLVRQMSAWGMRPCEAHDGPAALQALYMALDQDDPFRLAVIDMQMPGMDGETLGRVIRADARLSGTRMVMLTSLGARGDAKKLAQIGFAGYLAKPVRHQELRSVLSLVLGGQAGTASTLQPGMATRHTAREALPCLEDRAARILLVEDNITNQQVALGLLRKMGLRADAVADGREALKALESIPYGLVLMDCQMPVMDGYEATRAIRASGSSVRNRQVPIIAMTAHAMQGDRGKCLEAGMNDYLSKPVVPRVLAETLARWLPARTGDAQEAPAVPEASESAAAEGASSEAVYTVLDRAVFMDRVMGDEALAGEIAATFRAETPGLIAQLAEAAAAGEWTAAARHAHTLKGSASMVGAEALRALALTMESACRGSDQAAIQALMPRLERAFEAAAEALLEFGCEQV